MTRSLAHLPPTKEVISGVDRIHIPDHVQRAGGPYRSSLVQDPHRPHARRSDERRKGL